VESLSVKRMRRKVKTDGEGRGQVRVTLLSWNRRKLRCQRAGLWLAILEGRSLETWIRKRYSESRGLKTLWGRGKEIFVRQYGEAKARKEPMGG